MKEKHILFLAEYPNSHTIKEGMSQRMVAIDDMFAHHLRKYLFVSYRFYFKMEKEVIDDQAIQYRCNLFLHFFIILRLLISSKLIYIHSVLNALNLMPFFLLLPKNKILVLDIHGVVPEEQKYLGNKFKGILYGITEKYLFKRLAFAIAVTERMIDHYKIKYPTHKVEMISYPILPSNILESVPAIESKENQKITNIVYSGNLQSWQNIDLMLDVIKRNLSDMIHYTILTGSLDEMKSKLNSKGLGQSGHITVLSVKPDELGKYYLAANYGFVLRDNFIVNNVACPTKIIEYMRYGIIPIIKSDEIGDFKALGFDSLKVGDFNTSTIKPVKSEKNVEIIDSLLHKYKNINIKDLVLNKV